MQGTARVVAAVAVQCARVAAALLLLLGGGATRCVGGKTRE
jgi:hypothetical protein